MGGTHSSAVRSLSNAGQLGDATLAVDFTGWNKYVILADNRAFLFPRQANNVEWFERELAAYRALEPTGLAMVPRLIGAWRDEAFYPFPFAAVTRLRGVRPPDASVVLDQLGRAIAAWHDIAVQSTVLHAVLLDPRSSPVRARGNAPG